MNASTQRLCVWAGPAMIAFFLVGFVVIAGLVPPLSPQDSAAEIARFYSQHQTRVRIGLVVSIWGAALCYPWAAAISVQLKRIEGSWSPLCYTQLASGVTLGLLFAIPLTMMGAAAYRPTRSVELTQALNDLGWLTLVGVVTPAMVQCASIGLAMLGDRRREPVFPRWAGYFNIWCAIVFAGGGLVICFHGGPFAWNGIFAFWIPLTVFTIWFVVMTKVLLQAIATQQLEQDVSEPRVGSLQPV
jgi:hypothetical protein